MIEPYAFIRAHNEISTVKTCMESIQPVIKKGVIGIHPSIDGSPDDGTHDFLANFCRENPGYKLIHYHIQYTQPLIQFIKTYLRSL